MIELKTLKPKLKTQKMILISPETFWPDEKETLLQLFEAGLQIYHFRKPDSELEAVRAFMNDLPKHFHSKMVLHYHFDLSEEFNWRGFHFNKKNLEQRKKLVSQNKPFSYSAHTFREVESLKHEMEYQFLSPIFDSISKEGYRATFDFDKLEHFLQHQHAKVIALGGVSPENYQQLIKIGFEDAAVLGFIWNTKLGVEERIKRFRKFPTLR